MCSTRPKTTVEFPSRTVVCDRHSRTTGEAATLAGRTCRLGSRSMPAWLNSLTLRGKSVAVALT